LKGGSINIERKIVVFYELWFVPLQQHSVGLTLRYDGR
jgi:hypothetical protein